MAASIIDTLKQLITQGPASTLADKLGEDPQSVTRGLQAASTSIFAGLANKTNDAGAMSRTFDLISKPEITTTAIADDVALAREGRAPNEIGNMSARFLAELFGDRTSLVNGVVSDASGLSGQSATSVMRFAVPFALSFLGRHVRAAGLDLNGFTQLLANEKNAIMSAAPPGLSAALGVESPRASTTEREVAFQSDRRTTASDYGIRKEPPNPSSSNRWLWPTLATLAILALIWGSRARHRSQAIDTTSAGGEVAPTMPAPSAPISTPGSVATPDTSSFAPGGPIETSLVAFINDSTQHPSAAARFDFDRLVFAANSSKLDPQSDDQLQKVAMILKAHPNVIVRISGYADSAGTAATNMKLAAARAAVVRAALIRDGVAASHLQSQREQSMADTSADAALGQNRHVSLLVIKK